MHWPETSLGMFLGSQVPCVPITSGSLGKCESTYNSMRPDAGFCQTPPPCTPSPTPLPVQLRLSQ